MNNSNNDILVVVLEVIRPEAGLAYALTKNESISDRITFTLIKGVWDEEFAPEIGQEVIVSGVYRTGHGLRARTARPAPIA